MADGTMRREKLQRLGDDIINVGCSMYLWYREKTAPKTYGPYLTMQQHAELKKRPLRKKWDAFYYRHMGWMYRKPDESLVQYFKRGYRAWLFLGYYSDYRQYPKRLLVWPILTMLYILAFPLFPGSAVPGWEYTSPMVRLVGESDAPVVFSLYLLSGMVVLAIFGGLAAPSILKEITEEFRAGKTVWQVFGPPPQMIRLLKLPLYPVIRAYRYDRRLVLFPVLMFIKSFQFVAPRLQAFAVRYRKPRRERP